MAHRSYLQQLAQGSPGRVTLLRPARALLRRWELAQCPVWLSEAQAEQSPHTPGGVVSSAARAMEPATPAAPIPHAIRRPASQGELTEPREVRSDRESGSLPEPAKEDGPKAEGEWSTNRDFSLQAVEAVLLPQHARKHSRYSSFATRPASPEERKGVPESIEPRLERDEPMLAPVQPPLPATENEFVVRPAQRSRPEKADELPPVAAITPLAPVRTSSPAGTHAEVRIGTVEIVVTAPAPPQGAPVNRAPLVSPPALSRGYLSTIGLRQR